MAYTWLISLILALCWRVSGTVGAATLSVAQLASHPHRITGYGGDNSAGGYNDTAAPSGAPLYMNTDSAGSSQPHARGLTATSKAASNLSPYYALAYIMRIS